MPDAVPAFMGFKCGVCACLREVRLVNGAPFFYLSCDDDASRKSQRRRGARARARQALACWHDQARAYGGACGGGRARGAEQDARGPALELDLCARRAGFAGADQHRQVLARGARRRYTLARPEIVTEQVSVDGTRKWLLRLDRRAPASAPPRSRPSTSPSRTAARSASRARSAARSPAASAIPARSGSCAI